MAPVINDISSDLEDVPQFRHNPSLNPLPEKFKLLIKEGYPTLKTLELPGVSAEDAFASCLQAAQKMPRWTLVLEDPSTGVLEGYATTLLLRFKDDFTIRIKEEDGVSKVDMRSKSRIGKGDLGANAARIQSYFKLVQDATKSAPP